MPVKIALVTLALAQLTGTSGVSFNGVPASFTIESDTYIKATVPAGDRHSFCRHINWSAQRQAAVPGHKLEQEMARHPPSRAGSHAEATL